MSNRLLLYELDHREPIGYVDALGEIRHMDGRAATIKYDLSTGSKNGVPGWPKVIFADVPTILHLACGHTIAPLSQASAKTGPTITPNDVIVETVAAELIDRIEHALGALGANGASNYERVQAAGLILNASSSLPDTKGGAI